MGKKNGFLILNEAEVPKQVLRRYWRYGDIIAAADGGGMWLYQQRIVPNCLLGDFDSLPREVIDYFSSQGSMIKRYPLVKDHTDGYLALQWLVQQKVSKVYVLGGTGSRLDQLLGFLNSMTAFKIPIYYFTVNSTATLLKGEYLIRHDFPVNFSLIVLKKSIITLEKVGYPLQNGCVKKHSDLTISNFMLESEMKLISNHPVWFIGLGLNFTFEKCR